MADIYVCRQHGLGEPCDLCATNPTPTQQGETLEQRMRAWPQDLIAVHWAETLSEGEQSTLLTSSIRRLQQAINIALDARSHVVATSSPAPAESVQAYDRTLHEHMARLGAGLQLFKVKLEAPIDNPTSYPDHVEFEFEGKIYVIIPATRLPMLTAHDSGT